MSLDSEGGAATLGHWGVIHATGADAASFLHTQLTSDIASLTSSDARLAGYCSAKGRLLASFVVWRPSPESVMLACSADLLAATLKRLTMFVLRARCRLSDASGAVELLGLAGASARQALGDAADAPVWSHRAIAGASLIRLPDAAADEGAVPRWLWAGPSAAAPALPVMSQESWDRLEVQSGVARIVAGTVERFVPQMVNFESVGGVNFSKGCYPGQEVVARSQYRGTIKRRTLRFDSAAHALPGTEVFAAGDPSQPAGLVVNAAPAAGGAGSVLLVELKLAAADDQLHLREPGGPPLRPAPLPYPLPSDA